MDHPENRCGADVQFLGDIGRRDELLLMHCMVLLLYPEDTAHSAIVKSAAEIATTKWIDRVPASHQTSDDG